MERDSCLRQPLVGWLLGVLLAFCAFLPVASGSNGSPVAAPGAATLVRSGTPQHVEAVTAALRPDVARSPLHSSAATPPDQSDSLAVSSSVAGAGQTATALSASPTLSDARAPPSVRA
jgi:hypothetical protein